MREEKQIALKLLGREDINFLDGNGIDYDNEYDPSFVCDRNMATKLELHEAPNLENVEWANEQVHGICSKLTHLVLSIFTSQFLLTWEKKI